MNKYLFIGGTADGQWLEVPDFETNLLRIVPVLTSSKIVHFSGEVPLSLENKRHYYVPECFRTQHLTILFFRFDELTMDEAIAKLFLGYKP